MATTTATNGSSIIDDVKDYYGKTLQKTSDLKTGACTMGSTMGPHVRAALKLVHQEVKDKYYGCGLIIPDALDGAKVVDLGSGAGMDCYVLSNLVGEKGHVTGLDMTDEQIEVARRHIPYHTEKYGYKSPNIDFVQGYIEKLTEAGIKNNFYDIVVSNCVVNLSPDKTAVLTEAYNVLKEGGELYFSDIYSDKVVPENVRQHKVLWGECISGALAWNELHDIAAKVGFSAPRIVDAAGFDISKPDLVEVLGDLKFLSVTYRLFKLPANQEAACGAIYEGEIPNCPDEFKLDHNNVFKTGDPVQVNAEVATILKSSRLRDYFSYEKLPTSMTAAATATQERENPFEYVKKAGIQSGGCCGSGSSSSNKGGCC